MQVYFDYAKNVYERFSAFKSETNFNIALDYNIG